MPGCDKSYTHPSSLRKHTKMHELNGDAQVISHANGALGSRASSVESPNNFSKETPDTFHCLVENSSSDGQKAYSVSPSQFSGSSSSLAVSSSPSSCDDVYSTPSGLPNSYSYSYQSSNLVDEQYSKFVAEISSQKQNDVVNGESNAYETSIASKSSYGYTNQHSGNLLQNSRSFTPNFNSLSTSEYSVPETMSVLSQHRHFSMEAN